MNRAPMIAALLLILSLLSGFAHAEPTVININTATVETLASLNGVGESKAQAIVAYRTENGPFKSSDDLVNVKGIGERTVQKNADRMTVE